MLGEKPFAMFKLLGWSAVSENIKSTDLPPKRISNFLWLVKDIL